MALFGLCGYLFARLECEPAPMLLGLIVGPMMEGYLRRAMLLSRGDPTIFLRRPISLGILLFAILALVAAVVPAIRTKREEAFQE
jgi:TctA family transporter